MVKSILILVLLPGLFVACTKSVESESSGDAVLKSALEFYGSAEQIEGIMEVKLSLPEGGPAGIQIPGMNEPMIYSYAVSKPASVAFRPTSKSATMTFIQNGEEQYVEEKMFGKYTLKPSTGSLEKLVGDSSNIPTIMIPGAVIPLSLALGNMEADVVELSGIDIVDGVECSHLTLRDKTGKVELWIASDGEPRVLKARQSPPGEGEMELPEMPEMGGMISIIPVFDIRFTDLKINGEPGEKFMIQPAEGLEKADQLFPSFGEGEGMPMMDSGEHSSVGEKAPDVELASLDGKSVKLKELKGKVVILDFWATWCKPCVESLPGITKAADELKSKGVVFYAVNRLESREKVKKYLEEKSLKTPVVLDKDDSISRAFGVTGIPHTVIIDKSGKIKNVHTGFWPGMVDQLKKEVEELAG